MLNSYPLLFKQPIDYKLITNATNLAVSLINTKAWLKIPSTLSVDDALIGYLIKAATGFFEKITGRDLITKTYRTYLDNFPLTNGLSYYSGVSPLIPQYQDNGILLKKSQLQSVVSIKYLKDGTQLTLDAANYYFTINTDYSVIYLVNGVEFPSNIDVRKQAVEINFTAGYGVDDSFVPDDVQQALLQFISYLYDNRGDCTDKDKQNAAVLYFIPFKIIENI